MKDLQKAIEEIKQIIKVTLGREDLDILSLAKKQAVEEIMSWLEEDLKSGYLPHAYIEKLAMRLEEYAPTLESSDNRGNK